MQRIHLLIIDPQNDFCAAPGTVVDIPTQSGGIEMYRGGEVELETGKPQFFSAPKLILPSGGSLFVEGADKDMERLAGFIRKNKHRISDIHVTLDSHQSVHIAHPIFTVDRDGNHPAPYTTITLEDAEKGVWRAAKPSYQQRFMEYLRTLKRNGRYELMVWPPHCLVGSVGGQVHPVLYSALLEWESLFKRIDFVPKGNNPFTEHYSAYKADVPDPLDPTTQPNTRLVEVLEKADVVLISGEASTHCVANTVRDIADDFSDQSAVGKFVYLKDTCSPVPVVAHLEQQFITDMTARGMRLSATTDFF